MARSEYYKQCTNAIGLAEGAAAATHKITAHVPDEEAVLWHHISHLAGELESLAGSLRRLRELEGVLAREEARHG